MNADLLQHGIAGAQRQRGAILFVAMMFLIIIALIAITSSGNSVLQERMTGGLRNQQLALMAGETALRAGDRRLWGASVSGAPILACGGIQRGASATTPLFGVYCYRSANPNLKMLTFRSATSATTFASDSAAGTALNTAIGVDLANPGSIDKTSQIAANPFFTIEDMGVDLPPNVGPNSEFNGNPNGGGSTIKHIYRVTARAVGGTGTVMRVFESTFASKVN